MRFAFLFSLLLLAACATTSAPVVAAPDATCSDAALAGFVGQPATSELGARMLRESKASTLRWVAKGMMVTMDFRADRLTVYLDAANRVERPSCG